MKLPIIEEWDYKGWMAVEGSAIFSNYQQTWNDKILSPIRRVMVEMMKSGYDTKIAHVSVNTYIYNLIFKESTYLINRGGVDYLVETLILIDDTLPDDEVLITGTSEWIDKVEATGTWLVRVENSDDTGSIHIIKKDSKEYKDFEVNPNANIVGPACLTSKIKIINLQP